VPAHQFTLLTGGGGGGEGGGGVVRPGQFATFLANGDARGRSVFLRVAANFILVLQKRELLFS
jgi:hypothetical protein